MTFFETVGSGIRSIASSVLDFIGIDIGEVDTSTKVVGMFAVFVLMMLGTILVGLGYVAYRAKSWPKWMGTFAIGSLSISMLLWVLVPGWPLASTIGLIVGIVGAVVAVWLYRRGIEPKMSGMITLALGAGAVVLSLAIMLIEIYGGGGFFG